MLLVVLSAAAAVGLVVVVRRRAPAIGHFVQPAGAVGRLTVIGKPARRPYGIRDLRGP